MGELFMVQFLDRQIIYKFLNENNSSYSNLTNYYYEGPAGQATKFFTRE